MFFCKMPMLVCDLALENKIGFSFNISGEGMEVNGLDFHMPLAFINDISVVIMSTHFYIIHIDMHEC